MPTPFTRSRPFDQSSCETVQDINALADRIRNVGGVLTDGPTDNKEWKMQMLGIDDPDGYHISIFRNTA